MKKLILASFVCLALLACSGKTATNQEGLILPGVNGKAYNYTQAVSEKPVLIAVMAGFCGFCKRMVPLLDQLAADLKGKNVDVVLAFVDEDANEVKNALKDIPVENAKVVHNAGPYAQSMGVTGFPQMYLIGTDGMTVDEWTGYSPAHPDAMKVRIEEIIVK
jgi:thiol-disulfide isomerase/thioredoxin